MDMDKALKNMADPKRLKDNDKKPLKFVAYVDQGSGCDYMIACGKTLWKLESLTYDEAVKELKIKAIGDEGYWGEDELETITLFEIISVQQIPLSGWYSDARKLIEDEKVMAREVIEKMEFERLKRKFGENNK